ncbi:hypothetical protein MRB53_037293 [Persea americana]|nr:hypothetical protein MRB53_037293 [Persea americana]
MTSILPTKQSRHVFHLKNSKPFFSSENGSLQRGTAAEFPILSNLSMKRLVLGPGAIREPHWHANCNELTYCLSGKVLVTILDTGDDFSNLTLTEGQMVHINSGALHHIEEIGGEGAELIIVFSSEHPKDFALQASFGAMTDAVLGNTYDGPSSGWTNIKRDTKEHYIVKREGKANVPDTAHLPNKNKFDVEELNPQDGGPGVGSAKKARLNVWGALKNLSMPLYDHTDTAY